MKGQYLFLLTIIFLLTFFNSCKKEARVSAVTADSDKDTISPSATIPGVWHILKDSFFVAEAPPFFKTKDSSYIGVAADYYNFKPDGNLYRREGNTTDTLAYEILPGNQINFVFNNYITLFDSLGNASQVKYKKTYTITTLTAANLTMSTNLSSDLLTPEGYFANRLKLIK